MTENNSTETCIKCSRCKCKYINDDIHIKIDFGYNRLNERLKTCVKCRDNGKIKTTCSKCGFEVVKQLISRHHKTDKCKQWELMISRIDTLDPELIEYGYTFNGEPFPVYKDYSKTIEYREQYLGYDRIKYKMSIEEQIKQLEQEDDVNIMRQK